MSTVLEKKVGDEADDIGDRAAACYILRAYTTAKNA